MKKEASTLELTVEGTKIAMPVRVENLSTSKAGGTGFSFSTICATHRAKITAPKVCAECNGAPASTLKGYEVSKGNFVFLRPEQVDALKPRGDNSVHIAQFLPAEMGGIAKWAARIGGKAIVPGGDAGSLKRWAALRALLSSGPAIGTVTKGGSFSHAIFEADEDGAIVYVPLYLDEDVKPVPAVAVPELSPAEVAAFSKRRMELESGTVPIMEDPYRKAREDAIMAAANGELPPPDAPIAQVVTKAEVNVLDLI